MLIETVLEHKGHDVRVIAPTATVADAAKELHRYRIGVLVVGGRNGEILGILSERDVIRAVGDRGPKAMAFTVSDLMTRSVVSCSTTDTVDTVVHTMVRNRIRHVPVTENGRLVGLVSVRDLLAERLDEQTAEVRSFLTVNRCKPTPPQYAGLR